MFTSEDEEIITMEIDDKETSESGPTLYSIQFPNYNAHIWVAAAAAAKRPLITVHTKSPSTTRITSLIATPP
jgi:hypothetical protein